MSLLSRSVSSLLMSACALGALSQGGARAQVQELRACWLTQYTYQGLSEPALRAMAQNMLGGGLNTVYVAAYSGAKTWWPSQAYLAAGGEWASYASDPFGQVVRVFQEEGLRVGAWFEYGLAVGLSTHPLAQAHPDWLAEDRFGDPVTGENGGFVFLSPGHPDATQLIVDMARELAQAYPVEDIQLDRIRWGRKSSGREYGYEPVTSALYQAQYGAPPPTSANNAQWVAFREGLVNQLFQRCFVAIKAVAPTVTVSAAPTGSYGIVQHMQRWRSWLDGGYVDLIVPQMYATSLSSFQGEFATQLANAGPHADRIAVGYRASDTNDWQLVQAQLLHARAAGVPHACLWVYHSYGGPIAIQDELDHLAQPGAPWAQAAVNPFVSPRHEVLVFDDADGSPRVQETGAWADVSGSEVQGLRARGTLAGTGARVRYQAAVPRRGNYEVLLHWDAAPDRDTGVVLEVQEPGAPRAFAVDQTQEPRGLAPLESGYARIGRVVLDEAPEALLAELRTGSDPWQSTLHDGLRLALTPESTNYCDAVANSTGRPALMGYDGSTSLLASDLSLRVLGAPAGQFGMFVQGSLPTQVPVGNGVLCLSGVQRLLPAAQTSALGQASRALDYAAPPASTHTILPGSTWFFSYWYRDPAGPGGAGFNFADGLALTFGL